MPALFALLCVTVFVIWLLRYEIKQSPLVSPVLWIPTLWMLSVSCKPLGVWFGQGGSLESGSPIDRWFLIALLLLTIWMLRRRSFYWANAIRENAWLIALITFMLISILWSPIPFISFKRWTRELLALLMAFLVITERSPRQAIESILRRTAYVLIPFSVVLVKYFPDYGVSYGRWSGEQMWIGVTEQKNSLSLLCIISALYLVWALVKRIRGRRPSNWKYQTPIEILILLLTFWLMGGPQRNLFYSVTSNVAFALGLIILIGFLLLQKLGKSIYNGFLTAFLVITIFLGASLPFSGGTTVSSYSALFGRDATLTGRTQVWAALSPVALQRPLLGHGFGGFWTTRARARYLITNAHSGYLDEILDLGFIGMLLISIFLLSSCQKAHRGFARDFEWATLNILYIMVHAIHNFAESSINSFNAPLTAIILFFSVSSIASCGSEIAETK